MDKKDLPEGHTMCWLQEGHSETFGDHALLLSHDKTGQAYITLETPPLSNAKLLQALGGDKNAASTEYAKSYAEGILDSLPGEILDIKIRENGRALTLLRIKDVNLANVDDDYKGADMFGYSDHPIIKKLAVEELALAKSYNANVDILQKVPANRINTAVEANLAPKRIASTFLDLAKTTKPTQQTR